MSEEPYQDLDGINTQHWYKTKISFQVQKQNCNHFTVAEVAGAPLPGSGAFIQGDMEIHLMEFLEEKQNCRALTGSVTEQHLLLTSNQSQASWKHLAQFHSQAHLPLSQLSPHANKHGFRKKEGRQI